MKSEEFILRETTHSPLVNKNAEIDNSDYDNNWINAYSDFLDLCNTGYVDAYGNSTTYSLGDYVTYNGKLWVSVHVSDFFGVTPGTDELYWQDVFPTVLAHLRNRDTILAEGTADEVSASEIRAFIDAGLTSTTNLSISTQTGSSLKIESSTGADVTLLEATSVHAGLLNSINKIKLDNTTGVNTGDQTLGSLGAEAVANKATDFTVLNHTLYPTTQAVDAEITTVVPPLVAGLMGGYELQSNKNVSGGYVGLSALKIMFKNVADTFTSYFTNTNTASRTYTFQDRNGTIADDTDLALKAPLTPREQSVVSSATVTPTFLNDIVIITAQAVNLTLANPTGTAIPNAPMIIRIKDNGTARTISYGTQYRAIGVTLPTTTVISKTIYLGLIYNATETKWDVVGVNSEV